MSRRRQLFLACAIMSTLLVSIEAGQLDSRPDEFPSINKIDEQVSISDSGLPCGVALEPSSSSYPPPSPRISRGVETAPGEFPWMVNIKIGSSHICGGVIIDDRHILTVKHCFVPREKPTKPVDLNSVILHIGDYNQSTADGEQTMAIDRLIYTHVEPDEADDIALLRTKEPIIFELTRERIGSVNRICLPEYGPDFKFLHGSSVTLAGWGWNENGILPDRLMKVDESITACNRMDNGTLCTCVPAGMGGRRGDSGGPLVFRSASGQFVLAGLVRSGPGPNVTNLEGGDRRHANVYHYMPWIRSNTLRENF